MDTDIMPTENEVKPDMPSQPPLESSDLDKQLQEHKKAVEAAKEKYKDSLQAANAKTREELDKTLITLSTFSIGFLLGLRQQIYAQNKNLDFPWQLWLPLILFMVCILIVLASHFCSVWVNDRLIEAVENDGDYDSAHALTKYVRGLNIASAIAFVVGLVTSIVFIKLAASGKL